MLEVSRVIKNLVKQNTTDKNIGRLSILDVKVEDMCKAYLKSPKKSNRIANLELEISQPTVHKIRHKRLPLRVYKVQLAQKFQPNDQPHRKAFAANMLNHNDEDLTLLSRICFSDESTFHFCGRVNKQLPNLGHRKSPCGHRTEETAQRLMSALEDRMPGPFYFF